eukprot:6471749-Amphidinium_carterae.1
MGQFGELHHLPHPILFTLSRTSTPCKPTTSRLQASSRQQLHNQLLRDKYMNTRPTGQRHCNQFGQVYCIANGMQVVLNKTRR